MADVVWFLFVLAAALTGRAVHGVVAAAAAPARQLAEVSNSLADNLEKAGGAVGRTPLLGDDLAGVLGRGADDALALARSAAGQQDTVLHLAVLLGVLTAAFPIALCTAVRGTQRVRWARCAREARSLAQTPAGEKILALRSLQRRSARELSAVDDDPAEAWLAGDHHVIRLLARLELEATGVQR